MSTKRSRRIGDFYLCSLLGSGGYMTAFKVRHVGCQELCVLKSISKASDEQTKSHFTNEINILKNLSHPFIADLYTHFDTENDHVVVTEYASGGSLLDLVKQEGSISESKCRRIFSQLVSVLKYLHEDRRVVHRDLKLENILLDSNDNIKVIDFGFAKSFSGSSGVEFTSLIGSPAYVAPELAQGRSYNSLADIWSIGVVLYCLAVGRLPFEGSNTQIQLQKIVLSEPFIPSHLSSCFVDVLRRLLTKDPLKRITLSELSSHPFVSESDSSFVDIPISVHDKVWYEEDGEEVSSRILLCCEVRDRVCRAMNSNHDRLHLSRADSVSMSCRKPVPSLSRLCARDDENSVPVNDSTHVSARKPVPGRLYGAVTPTRRLPRSRLPVDLA